jgi:uncharacterized protein
VGSHALATLSPNESSTNRWSHTTSSFTPITRPTLETVGAGGNLTTDAQLAALAVEHQAELHCGDADFSRFPGLRWRYPLLDYAP